MATATLARSGMTVLERDLVPLADGFAAFWDADAAARRRMARAARRTYAEFRSDFGYAASSAALLTAPDAQPKTGKNAVPTFTLMLVPARSVLGNACPAASVGCGGAGVPDALHVGGGCLAGAGHGGFDAVQYARMVRMAFMLSWPWEFGVILAAEIVARIRQHGRIGIRLNCLSDIRWELCAMGMLERLHAAGVAIYDYTAYRPALRAGRPDWYHLTFSAKETHSVDAIRALVQAGHNVAVPFRVRKGQPLPETWHGMRVIDGDVTDYRPSDPAGVIVGLRAKGSAIRDTSGFIRDI